MRRYIASAVVGGIVGGLVVGLVVALVFLVLGNEPRSALSPAPVKPATVNGSGGPTREDMHEAMGPDAEKMMGQCTAMMAMMTEMQNMMPGSGTGMMGGQNGDSMRDMMRRMMPQSGL